MPTKEELERAAPRDRGADVNLRSAVQMREYAAAADRIADDRPTAVLDWGCGFGHMSNMLRQRGLSVVSMEWHPDVPEGEVRRLERYPDIEATFTQEPVRLPYPDAAFDAVLSMGVLEHVHDPAASLDELHRVLRPGGRIYVYKLANRTSYLEWVAKRVGFYYHGQLEHDRLYTRQEARALVEAHGFAIEELHLANVLPLTIPLGAESWLTRAYWAANRRLARLPGLNRLATNVELIARRVP